jgi:rhomboid family GlyGly-CTERM serine protease
VTAHLAYERQAILSGQLWRLWTAHLVHFSWQHAISDTLVLFAATTYACRLGRPRLAWAALAIGAPVISLALLLAVPEMSEYRGASGLALMMVVLCGALKWPSASRNGRLLLAALGVGVLAKTVAEAYGATTGAAGLPLDVAVAWQAHAVGALCAAPLAMWHWRGSRSNPLFVMVERPRSNSYTERSTILARGNDEQTLDKCGAAMVRLLGSGRRA